MSLSEDAAREVDGRPHAGNTAGFVGDENANDGTQCVGVLRGVRPRDALAVTKDTRLDDGNRASGRARYRNVKARRTCFVSKPRSMPARARLGASRRWSWW